MMIEVGLVELFILMSDQAYTVTNAAQFRMKFTKYDNLLKICEIY